MYIEKLELKGFGKFEGVSLKLEKGMNIIYGHNESGKSTLLWFIKSMLYGLKGGRASRDGIPPPIKRFKPWSGAQYGGSMEYRLDDGSRIRVERNFDNNSVVVYDSSFNNITDSFDFSREKSPLFAEKHLGINEVCFEKTVLVKQMETRLDEEGRAELLGRVANVSQTGFEDVSLKKAQNSLREDLKNFVGTERTRTSPIDRLGARLEELRAKKAGAAERKDFLQSTEAGLSRDVQEKAALCKTRDYMEQVRELIDLRKRVEEGKAKGASVARLLDAIVEAEKAVAAEVEIYEELKDKAVVRRTVPMAYETPLRRNAQGKYRKGSRRNHSMKTAAFIMLFCSLAAVVLALLTKPVVFIFAGVLLGAGLLLLLIKGRENRQEEEIKAEEDDYAVEDLKAARLLESKLQEIIRLKDALKDLCEKASAVSGKQAGSAAQVVELLAEVADETDSLDLKLNAGIVECMEKFPQAETGFFSSLRLKSILADSGLKWLEDTWLYEYEKLEEKLQELTLIIREHETVLKNDVNGAVELQLLEEEIAELEGQKNKLEDTGVSLKLALDVLEEAANEIQRDYAPALSAKMSGIINKITDGRYKELKADEVFSLLTISPETGNVAQIQVLSGGTVDQMYLALRLAAAELAFNGEALPIMLDEAFSQYDDHRTLETLKYLSEIYSEGQVLLFTSKGREVELAEAACVGQVNLIDVREIIGA